MDVKGLTDVSKTGKAVLHFWASWSEPCKLMDVVFLELGKEHTGITFQRVEAEEVDEVTAKFEVTSVPTFVFLKDGALVDKLEGADAPTLTQKTAAFAASSGPAAAAAAPTAAVAAAPAAGTDVLGRIKFILSTYPVVVFMKGSAEAPRCGFSARVVEALQKMEVPFQAIDILQDEALRQGMKDFSNWPTYPQLYVKGELVGGCDIIQEMAASGELKQLVDEKLGSGYRTSAAAAATAAAAPVAAAAAAAPAATETKEQLQARLKALLDSNKVMLFMKGDPETPRCGFSRKVVDALKSIQVPFGTFDILQDEAVRQGMKEYSNWPTYPQLYVKGELVGGCDIILEMQQAGELKTTVDEMLYRMDKTE